MIGWGVGRAYWNFSSYLIYPFLFSYVYDISVSTEIHVYNEYINKHAFMGCLTQNTLPMGCTV